MGVDSVITVRDERIPEDVPMSAGYTPGVPRLGIPALLVTDASLGITNPGYRPGDTATARRSDVVIVLGIRVEGEGFDLPDLTLPWGQDAEHHCGAGNRQPGRHAVARPREGNRSGVASRAGRRRLGDRVFGN
jgi:hypothetical protein